jgi:hypothetical protein
MATEEGWHTVEDGKKLYTKTWKVLRRPTRVTRTYRLTACRQRALPKPVLSLYTVSATIVSALLSHVKNITLTYI